MTLNLSALEVDRLAAAIARHLQPEPDMEMLTLKKLATETGMSYEVLRAAALAYEAGNPDGLRCTRASAVESRVAPVLVAREWFCAWRERQADRNSKQAHLIGKATV